MEKQRYEKCGTINYRSRIYSIIRSGERDVQIRTGFVKEYQEERQNLIKLVKTEENEADINTKITPNIMFKTHQAKIV